MGGAASEDAGDHRRVVEGAGPVAVLGAHLQLRGHHAADARGGTQVQNRGQELEGHHELRHQGS